MDAIIDGLFPSRPIRPRREWPSDEPAVPVTALEVQKLAVGIPGNKAPGLDGIPGEALKLIARAKPEQIAAVFTQFIQQGVFPSSWERARLVLLRKANRPLDEPNS